MELNWPMVITMCIASVFVGIPIGFKWGYRDGHANAQVETLIRVLRRK